MWLLSTQTSFYMAITLICEKLQNKKIKRSPVLQLLDMLLPQYCHSEKQTEWFSPHKLGKVPVYWPTFSFSRLAQRFLSSVDMHR